MTALQPSPSDGTMEAKGFRQKLALLLLGILLALLVLEGAVRLYVRLAEQDRTLRYDSVLGWSLNPGAHRMFRDEAQPYRILINSRGFRDAEHSLDKPLGTFRIALLGDSFVFGSGGVEPQARFSDLLARTGKNIEALNFGVPGYSTDQEYLQLKNQGLGYHPDLVLLCLFVNDFDESFVTWNASIWRPKGYFSREGDELVFHLPRASTLQVWSEKSYVLATALRVWGRLLHPPRERRTVPVVNHEEESATFRLLLVKMRDLCRASNAQFVAVYLPFQQQKRRNDIQEVLEYLRRNEGLKVLDLTEDLNQADAQQPAYFRRDVHLNERGNQLVAEALRAYLMQEQLLPPAAGR